MALTIKVAFADTQHWFAMFDVEGGFDFRKVVAWAVSSPGGGDDDELIGMVNTFDETGVVPASSISGFTRYLQRMGDFGSPFEAELNEIIEGVRHTFSQDTIRMLKTNRYINEQREALL